MAAYVKYLVDLQINASETCCARQLTYCSNMSLCKIPITQRLNEWMIDYVQAMLRRAGHQTQQEIQMRNREVEEERIATIKKLEKEALVSKVS